MTAAQIAIVALVVIVLGVAAGFLVRYLRLRRRFGPEYQQVVADHEGWLAGLRELRQREKRHTSLHLRELSPADRQRFAQQWQAVQAEFVSDPARAVVAGDDLVTRLVGQVGYPTRDFDEQMSMLSVEHARTLGHYRDAHEIFLKARNGAASTEELRQALVHYRAIFADVLGADPALRPADRR
jgi:hypothetical protein